MQHDGASFGLLLPYQARWYKDRSRVKVCEKGRRTGITWTTAAEAVEVAASPDGMDVFYMCHKEDTAKEFIEACTLFASVLYDYASMDGVRIVDNLRRDLQVTICRFSSGHKIQLLSSAATEFRGHQGYYIIDEAAHQRGLERKIEAAMATRVWGGRIAVISTHYGDTNPFNLIVQDTVAKKNNYSLHTVRLTDAVEEGLYRRVCQVSRMEWSAEEEKAWVDELLATPGADQEFQCIPSSDSEMYFPRYVVERCMKGGHVLRLHLESNFLMKSAPEKTKAVDQFLEGQVYPLLHSEFAGVDTWYGQDFARSERGDLSVIAIVRLEKNLDRACRLIVEMRGVPYEQQAYILDRIAGRLQRLRKVAIDAGGNGNYLAEHARLQFGDSVVSCVHVTNHVYNTMLPKLKASIGAGTFSMPQDSGILSDFGLVRLKDGSPIIDRAKEGAGFRHGDAVVAMMLALDASLEGGTVKAQTVAGYHKNRHALW